GERRSGATTVAPISRSRVCTAGVSTTVEAAPLSFCTIAAGTFFGRKNPLQVEASKSVSPCSCTGTIDGEIGERVLVRMPIAVICLLSISVSDVERKLHV